MVIIQNKNMPHGFASPSNLISEAHINVRGKVYTSVQCGDGGNCFFQSIARGLLEHDIAITHSELRTVLSEWLENSNNGANFGSLIGVDPPDIIPHLGHMAGHCPTSDGWQTLTETWN